MTPTPNFAGCGILLKVSSMPIFRPIGVQSSKDIKKSIISLIIHDPDTIFFSCVPAIIKKVHAKFQSDLPSTFREKVARPAPHTKIKNVISH